MQIHDLVGYAAATLTTASFVPQARLTLRDRNAHGVSLAMYTILSSGVALWLIYGVLIVAWPIIVANSVTLVLALFILGMKIRFG